MLLSRGLRNVWSTEEDPPLAKRLMTSWTLSLSLLLLIFGSWRRESCVWRLSSSLLLLHLLLLLLLWPSFCSSFFFVSKFKTKEEWPVYDCHVTTPTEEDFSHTVLRPWMSRRRKRRRKGRKRKNEKRDQRWGRWGRWERWEKNERRMREWDTLIFDWSKLKVRITFFFVFDFVFLFCDSRLSFPSSSSSFFFFSSISFQKRRRQPTTLFPFFLLFPFHLLSRKPPYNTSSFFFYTQKTRGFLKKELKRKEGNE